jgi:two-component system alkaline phosphatase synthesis response regulator PhoP
MTQDREAKSHILVCEDEHHIAEGLKLNLELAGHQVSLARNGKEGVEIWKKEKIDLIVLDIMMPEMDGHGVLDTIRKQDLQIPILILSAKNESVDKVKAFKGGVDDYLGKPFSLEELLLRIERLLYRVSKKPVESALREFTFGPNAVFMDRLKAKTENGEIDLTEQECKILKYFFDSPNKALSRGEILEVGWGYSEEVNTRTLDNFMVRFRKYFEKNPKKPVYFCSVRGVGYLFNPDGTGR